jgi:hypothetical protein
MSPRVASFALMFMSWIISAWSHAAVPGTLVRRLEASGRAEVALQREVIDPLSGGRRIVSGRLAIEPPDRVDVRFPANGERIAIRGDGGEWLQPDLRQMIRLGPDRAASARRWWTALAGQSGAGVVARRLAADHFVIVGPASEDAGSDSASVWLDGAGLPTRLEVHEGESEPTVYRFSGWRFRKARGMPAFRITAPAEYEVVDLP